MTGMHYKTRDRWLNDPEKIGQYGVHDATLNEWHYAAEYSKAFKVFKATVKIGHRVAIKTWNGLGQELKLCGTDDY